MRASLYRLTAVLCLLWAGIWLALTPHAMLDDSLIHLRYAVNLAHYHFITFDGIHPTFGTSSPLYVTLLALVYRIWPSVFVPKLISVVAYLALLAVIAYPIIRLQTTQLVRSLRLLLLASVSSVMGVRWLADGMESGLVCLSAVCLALFAGYSLDLPLRKRLATLQLIAGFCLTLLRLELLSLCGVCAIALFISRTGRGAQDWWRKVLLSLPVLLGGVLAMLCVRYYFGSILPDTAIAKASSKPSLGLALLFPQLLASSVALGIGSAAVWLATLTFALQRGGRRNLLQTLAANAAFPLVVALSCMRGQAVQGVRYFLWAILFSTTWNLVSLERFNRDVQPALAMSDCAVLAGVGILILCLQPVDIFYGRRTMEGRSHTFDVMRADGLDRLKGRTLLADDIGFISYFSQANVCDLNGLVNGRAFAKATQDDRISACLARQPIALFLTEPRVNMLQGRVPSFDQDWSICERIDFPNVRTQDTHYLLVRKHVAAELCPAGYSRTDVRRRSSLPLR